MILPKTFISARTIKYVTLYDNQFVLDISNAKFMNKILKNFKVK